MFGTIHQTSPHWPQIPQTPGEQALSDAMVGYWTSFAKTGRPSAPGVPNWPAYGNSKAAMLFTDAPEIRRDILGDRFTLMEELVCRRRAAGTQQWNWNVGVASPQLPPGGEQCR